MTPIWIIGSGGHAAVVIDAARASGEYEVMGCLDDSPARMWQRVLGVPVLGTTSTAELHRLGVTNAIVAIGANAVRAQITQRLSDRVAWSTVVHPRACIGDGCQIRSGTVIMAGAIIQPNSRIGEHAIVNTAATIDHDGHVDSYAHIGPGSHLAGSVVVGQGTQLGVGVLVIPEISIGEWSVIGAGAVVTGNLPGNVLAVGAPAKVIKILE